MIDTSKGLMAGCTQDCPSFLISMFCFVFYGSGILSWALFNDELSEKSSQVLVEISGKIDSIGLPDIPRYLNNSGEGSTT